MSYQFARASSQYLQKLNVAFPVAQDQHMTVLGWVRTGSSASYTVMGMFSARRSDTSANDFVTWGINTTNKVRSNATDGSSVTVTSTGALISNNTWGLVGAIYRHSSAHTYSTNVFGVSGGAVTWGTESASTCVIDPWLGSGSGGGLFIGQYMQAVAPGNFMDGYIAEFAIYQGILTDAQLIDHQTYYASSAAVKNGIGSSLKAYWPLLNDANCDATYGGSTYNLDLVNAPTLQSGTHPTLQTFAGASGAVKARYQNMLREGG
jgi:hypothetical protein